MLFRNVSGERRELPSIGVSVADGETFEATGAFAENLLTQTDVFRRVDTPARQKAAARRVTTDSGDAADTEES